MPGIALFHYLIKVYYLNYKVSLKYLSVDKKIIDSHKLISQLQKHSGLFFQLLW